VPRVVLVFVALAALAFGALLLAPERPEPQHVIPADQASPPEVDDLRDTARTLYAMQPDGRASCAFRRISPPPRSRSGHRLPDAVRRARFIAAIDAEAERPAMWMTASA